MILFPVDGQWSQWTDKVYTDCSKTCGGGERTWTRKRDCNSPAPQFNGKPCPGSSEISQKENCAQFSCPGKLASRSSTNAELMLLTTKANNKLLL